MSFDTKYRPTKFSDVLGQDATVRICREIVRQGKGRYQSYVFAGGHGSGKTTTARILARAILCGDPVEGNPCDRCDTCISMLETGGADGFVEMDAATNSKVDDIRKMVEEAEYSTTTGASRVYLIDEAHRLSKEALDGLLKSMEDNVQGSGDKKLVCIFCTTEPEKMRSTIFSRCAPAFTIRMCPPEVIAERLAYVCERESIEYDRDALVTIAEVNRCHIRPCLKAVENMGLVGPLTVSAVAEGLQLDNVNRYIKVLAFIGKDLTAALSEVEGLNATVSPSTVYGQLAEAALLAYKVHLGVAKPPGYWKPEVLRKLGSMHGDRLLTMARVFAERPSSVTQSMLGLDIAKLHHAFIGTHPLLDAGAVVVQVPTQVPSKGTSAPAAGTSEPGQGKIEEPVHQGMSDLPPGTPREATEVAGVHIDPRGVRRHRETPTGRRAALTTAQARAVLSESLAELKDGIGLPGQHELGGTGADTLG